MYNKKKKTVPLIMAVVVAVIILVVVSSNIAESNKIQKLKNEYIALLDEKMAGVYEDEECIEYQLSNISYSVTNLEKTGGGKYTVSVVVDCTSDDPELWSATESLLAYAVEEYVPGGYNDDVEASTGDVITLYNNNYKDSYFGQYMVTVNVNGKCVHKPETRDYSNSGDKDMVTCKSCGRKFQKGSENAKSIRNTNMCTNCYNNYKNAIDAFKELPVN